MKLLPPIVLYNARDYAKFRKAILAKKYSPEQQFMAFKFGQWYEGKKKFISPMKYNYHPILHYVPGRYMAVKSANPSRWVDCGAGVNVATYNWIRREYPNTTGAIFTVMFRAKDVAAVPSSKGKFRLFRCLVGEIYEKRGRYKCPKL